MNRVPDTELTMIPGETLITESRAAGRALALAIARHTIHNLQPDLDILISGRAIYSASPRQPDRRRPRCRTGVPDHRRRQRLLAAIRIDFPLPSRQSAAIGQIDELRRDRHPCRPSPRCNRRRRHHDRTSDGLYSCIRPIPPASSAPTMDTVTPLATIVLVRTFLSFSLELEITGAIDLDRSIPYGLISTGSRRPCVNLSAGAEVDDFEIAQSADIAATLDVPGYDEPGCIQRLSVLGIGDKDRNCTEVG